MSYTHHFSTYYTTQSEVVEICLFSPAKSSQNIKIMGFQKNAF